MGTRVDKYRFVCLNKPTWRSDGAIPHTKGSLGDLPKNHYNGPSFEDGFR